MLGSVKEISVGAMTTLSLCRLAAALAGHGVGVIETAGEHQPVVDAGIIFDVVGIFPVFATDLFPCRISAGKYFG